MTPKDAQTGPAFRKRYAVYTATLAIVSQSALNKAHLYRSIRKYNECRKE